MRTDATSVRAVRIAVDVTAIVADPKSSLHERAGAMNFLVRAVMDVVGGAGGVGGGEAMVGHFERSRC